MVGGGRVIPTVYTESTRYSSICCRLRSIRSVENVITDDQKDLETVTKGQTTKLDTKKLSLQKILEKELKVFTYRVCADHQSPANYS